MTLPPKGMRGRLLLLMLAAALPAFAVIGGLVWWMWQHECQRRGDELLALAQSLAARHRENLDGMRLLLANLARVPEIRAGGGDTCARSLAATQALAPPHLSNLFVVRPDGTRRCDAHAPAMPVDVAGMAWFQDALAAPSFHVGEYHMSRRTGAPALLLTHTLRSNGRVDAVLAAALDLAWLTARPQYTGLPEQAGYAIVDNTGAVLLARPGGGAAASAPAIAPHPHWRTLAGLTRSGLFRGPGGDGVEHVYAYAPLGPAARPYARLVVDMPQAGLMEPGLDLVLFGAGGLAAAMGLGLLLGWTGIVILLHHPLEPVLATLRRVAEGDLSARTSIEEASHGEVRRLANEVDRMAEALGRRDRALTEALERAQAYLDVVGVMVLLLTPKGSVALANRKACEVLGRDARECLGSDWFEHFLPRSERDEVRRVFADILAGRAEPAEYHENHVLTAARQPRLVAWHNSLLRDPAGQPMGILSAGQDITDLRRTEDELRDSRERYRTLVEHLPGTVYRCELHHPWRVEYISQGVERLTGIPAGHFLGGGVAYGDLIHPDDRAAVERAVAEGIETRGPFTCVYRIRHTNGAWRWAQERGQAMFDPEGHPVWLDGVILDITELRLLQEEQARLTAQLQQAQKMEALGQLTGGIAHDFNNILAAVLGFAKLALRRHAPDPESELADYLREVITAGERARDLVSRMLAFSRAQPGRKARPMAPLPLIKEAVKMLRATIPATIAMEVTAPRDLPDIALDPVDLHQILVNLVINARDAVDGQGRIAIGLAPERAQGLVCAACHERIQGEYVVLSVADDGQGIAPEALAHIFEPFFTTKAVGKGTGMGLAMVHGLVRRAGGHFQVDSRAGTGTTFRVYLPVAAAVETAPSPSPAPVRGPRQGPRGRLLVVDDEPALLRLLATGLEAAGWRVDAHADPRGALAALRADPRGYAAVISDQAMPGMNGLELIRALREAAPRLPAILCTGYPDGLGTDSPAAGIWRICQKPVDTDELLARLDEVSGHELNLPGNGI